MPPKKVLNTPEGVTKKKTTRKGRHPTEHPPECNLHLRVAPGAKIAILGKCSYFHKDKCKGLGMKYAANGLDLGLICTLQPCWIIEYTDLMLQTLYNIVSEIRNLDPDSPDTRLICVRTKTEEEGTYTLKFFNIDEFNEFYEKYKEKAFRLKGQEVNSPFRNDEKKIPACECKTQEFNDYGGLLYEVCDSCLYSCCSEAKIVSMDSDFKYVCKIHGDSTVNPHK